MTQNASDNKYFLINAGRPRAAFRPPARAAGRRSWNRWLKGTVAAIGLSGAVGFALATNGTKEPLEATVQMERLAAKVESTKALHSDTAHEIARLMAQPWYDCSQVTCGGKLQARNGAVRSRLKALMATKASAGSVAGIGKQGPGLPGAEAITTSAVGAAR